MKYYILSLFILVFSAGCEKDAEILSKEYPVVITKEPESLNASGVTFRAGILNMGNENITDYGFNWSSYETEYTYSIRKEKSLNDFKLQVKSDLSRNSQYWVQAYVKTPNHLVLGNKITFESEGSLLPVIEDFSPKEAFDGSRITIAGSGFSYNKNRNQVTVNGEIAEVIYADEDSIVCITPKTAFYGETEIQISVGDNTVKSNEKLKINGPEIENFSINQGYAGEIIFITGKNFTQNGSFTELYFGEQKGEIRSVNESKIEAVVPSAGYFELFEDKTVQMKVVNGLKITTAENDFNLLSSWDKKKSLYYNASDGKIFTYGDKAFLLDQSKDVIHVYDPLNDTWKQERAEAYPHVTDGSLYITIGDSLYLTGGYVWGYEQYKEMWVFDMKNRNWTRKNDLPFSFLTATSFKYDNKIHIITEKGEHWQCDFIHQKCTRLNDFPAQFEYSFAHSWVSNNKIFATVYGRTFQYNPINDSWIEKSRNPVAKGYYSPHAIGFSYKNKGYIYDTEYEFLYRYNDSEDLWVKVCDVPVALYNHPRISIFVLNDMVYFEDVNQNNEFMYAYKN